KVVEIVGREPGFFYAVVDGVRRDSGVVLLASEALFLRGRDDLAVDHDRGGAIVVERGDAEDGRPLGHHLVEVAAGCLTVWDAARRNANRTPTRSRLSLVSISTCDLGG